MTQESSRGDVVARLQQITEELKTIQEEIFAQLFPPEKISDNAVFLESPASRETIIRFKAGIDNLRHTLWLYIDTVLQQPEVDSERQNRLLMYATEMLRALSHSAPFPQKESFANSSSFVSHLLSLVNSYMEDHDKERNESNKEIEAARARGQHFTGAEAPAPQELRSDAAEQKTAAPGGPMAIMIA